MEYIRLGKTNLLVSRVALGAMRLSGDSAASVIRKAYESGINFFDTSGRTPESEKLLGDALYDIRQNVFLATTTSSETPDELQSDLEASLMTFHCDFVDLYQFETESAVPVPGEPDRIYDTLVSMRESGRIRHFGLVTKNLETAETAVRSGLYETIQFPFSMVSSEQTAGIVTLCAENDIGFIAMQPLGGGLIQNIPLALGFLSQFENVVPIWGVQTAEEMEQILYFNEHPPVIDEKFRSDVERVRIFFN